MHKSSFDKRQFEYKELTNGLRIIVVQDPNCDKTACSVTLNAGHFDDDKDCYGLAHLLEHALFQGNDSFPEANSFHQFVETHGGSVNALTGTEYTRYFFDTPQEFEELGLAHLYAILTQPLFLEASIQGEIEAIDAEFLLKQKDDLRRLYQVHKETCNPAHPFSQFSVGNKQTYAPFSLKQLREKLICFHRRFYRPNNACLCFVSKNSIALSLRRVEQVFADWQVASLPIRPPLPHLYLAENLSLQINILPRQNAKRLILTFALPAQQEHFRSKPLNIISHMLGDEGQGSLLDFYKRKDWATSLSAGGGIEGSTFKDFNVNLQLTQLGIAHCDDIIAAFFSYINIIENTGVEAWRAEETAALSQLIWDFPEQEKAIDEATHLSQAMFEYPAEYVVAGDYILDCPSATLTMQMLTFFTAQNLRIKLLHADVETQMKAQWYDTPYSVEPISVDRLSYFKSLKWRQYLSLPQANQFLAPCENIRKAESCFALPKPIIETNGLNIWFGQNDQFRQPKGHCFLTFDCEAIQQGVEVVAAKRLWVSLLNEKLNQKYYQANLAGLHFHFYPHQAGFSLQTHGFNEKQLEFCSKLLTQIVTTENFSHNFLQVKEKQQRTLTNALLNKPINRLFSRLGVILQQQNQTPIAIAKTMQKLTLKNIATVKEQLLNKFYLEGLMYGNWSSQEGYGISDDINSFRQSFPAGQKVHRGVADLRHSQPTFHHVDCQHQEPAIVVYFQAPDASLKVVALTILAEQLMAAPFFTELRTKQQFGYLVGSGYIPFNEHPGIGFYIQSPRFSVDQMLMAIHQFLHQIEDKLADYHDIWQPLKEGVMKQLAVNDSNLSMQSQRLWMAIGRGDNQFNYSKRISDVILKIEFSELKSYLNKLISRDGFGEIVLYSGPQKITNNDLNANTLTDIQIFKSSSPYL